MNPSGLRLDQAPPFSVPLRFFLTAPLFAVLAAALLAWQGPEMLASRWTPALLAATHLLTLGFLTMVMMGALMQMLPVLAGAPVPRARAVAGIVHVLLAGGVPALSLNFLAPWSPLRLLALALLGGGILLFLGAAAFSLARTNAKNPSVSAMRLALAGLAVTALVGLALVWLAGRSTGTRAPPLTDIHLAWGLIGWVALLVTGVAYQVVPMFQLTPAYPPWMRRFLAPALFLLLAALSAGLWLAPASDRAGVAARLVAAVIAAALAAVALTTLSLQRRRRRRLPDVTVRFWVLAMTSLLLGIGLWLGALGGVVSSPRLPLLLGTLGIVGFASSAIHGMLYKIVPFLAWLHLQNFIGKEMGRASARPEPPRGEHARDIRYALPNMKEILPDRRIRPHPWIHAAALALLFIAMLAPQPWIYPAAFMMAVSYGWLLANLISAARLYRRRLRPPRSATADNT
jgi:hypothetical protein